MGFNLGRRLSGFGRSAAAMGCALVLLSTLGCGGGDEASEDATGTATIVEEKGTREITLPGTEANPVRALLAAGELPEGYPADIPPPAGAEPKNAMIIPNQGGLVTFVSDMPRADVFEYFKKELAGQGWSLETEEDSLRSMIRAAKEGRKATVTVATGASSTEIAITFEGS